MGLKLGAATTLLALAVLHGHVPTLLLAAAPATLLVALLVIERIVLGPSSGVT